MIVKGSMRQSINGREMNGETYEVAEEAKQVEPMRLDEKQLSRHALASEFARVCRQPIDGMYIMPAANDPFEWFGLLFIRGGVFTGGIFRFTISIPQDFPRTVNVPIVRFDLDIFHPNVDLKTNQLDLSRSFPDGWKKEKHQIIKVLMVIERTFFSLDVDCDSCANPEAAILWKEHRDKFKEMTKDCVNRSRAQIYDDPIQSHDPNAIRLTPWDPSLHESVREKMMRMSNNRENVSWGERAEKQRGYSWVDTERMTYMTEPINMAMDAELLAKAEQDRLTHGIEKLDLSGVLEETSPVNSDRSQDVIIDSASSSDRSSEHRILRREPAMSIEREERIYEEKEGKTQQIETEHVEEISDV